MKYPLVIESAVFFWMPVTYVLLLGYPYSGPFLFTAVPTAICAVSIAGSLFFLSGRFTETTRRYYVIPLFLDLLAVFALGAIIVITGKGEIPGSVPDIVWAGWEAGTLLLAPCSFAVFLAMPAAPRVRYVACAITAIICAPVAIALGLLIKDYPYGIFESAIGLMSLYWIAFMPAIGVCYLAMAWYAKSD